MQIEMYNFALILSVKSLHSHSHTFELKRGGVYVMAHTGAHLSWLSLSLRFMVCFSDFTSTQPEAAYFSGTAPGNPTQIHTDQAVTKWLPFPYPPPLVWLIKGRLNPSSVHTDSALMLTSCNTSFCLLWKMLHPMFLLPHMYLIVQCEIIQAPQKKLNIFWQVFFQKAALQEGV